jgi:hypothetical protein
MSVFVAFCNKPGETNRFRTRAVEWRGGRSAASMSLDMIFVWRDQVYDMLLVLLFFFVVLSPFVIHAGLNWVERIAARRAAHAPKKDPRSAWVPDASSSQTVSSAAPSAR